MSRCVSCAVALAAFFYDEARADSVTLNSGEKLEGTVISESDEEVVFNAQLSAAISDQRTIPKTEIANLERDQPDEIAWRAIQNYNVDPLSSYSPESYVRLVQTLKHFAFQYPDNPHSTGVRTIIDALEQEQARVATGEVKFLGGWLTPELAEKRRLQIDAQYRLAAMRQQAAAGDFVGALNAFDLLDKKYSVTRFYPDAVELAQRVLVTFQRQLAARAQRQAYELAEFKKGLGLSPEQKAAMVAADQKQRAADAAALAAATKSGGSKWPPFIPRSPQSVDVLQKLIAPELQRLALVPVAKMRAATAAVDRAKSALAAKNLDGADRELKTATQLWAACEEALYGTLQLTAARAAASPTPAAKPRPSVAAKPSAARR